MTEEDIYKIAMELIYSRVIEIVGGELKDDQVFGGNKASDAFMAYVAGISEFADTLLMKLCKKGSNDER